MPIIPNRTVFLAMPHGFCMGVRRAIEMAESALSRSDQPLYAVHPPVHNPLVTTDLEAKGLRFAAHISEIPRGDAVLFSAHGVPPAMRAAAIERDLTIVDSTCPFVQKIHDQVNLFVREGCAVAVIGHAAHVEVIGIVGEAPSHTTVIETLDDAESYQPPDPDKVAAVTQTTLSESEVARIIDILRRRFPSLRTSPVSDICHATTRRQRAAAAVAKQVPLVLVLGASHSSNTRRLCEVAEAAGSRAQLVSTLQDLNPRELSTLPRVGLTAGASTPKTFIDEILRELRKQGFDRIEITQSSNLS